MNNGTWRLSDKINIFFIVSFGILALLHYKNLSFPEKVLTVYVSLFVIQVILVRSRSRKVAIRVFHDLIFPVISVLLIFDTMTDLVPAVNPHDIDYKLIRADYLLFGMYPTVFLERFINPYLTELLQWAYSTYYFLPVILGIALKVQKKEREFQEGLSLILLCFYLSYVGYLLFPALGPRYTMLHLQSVQLKGVFAFDFLYNFLNSIEGIKRDAFPSGHTGITLMVLHLAYRFEKRLFLIYAPLTVLMILATVYCRYHYVVDVLAGIGLYVITLILGRMLLRFRRV